MHFSIYITVSKKIDISKYRKILFCISSWNYKNILSEFSADDDKRFKGEAHLNGHKIPLVLSKTRRRKKLNPHGERSKYICIPRNVKEAGTHIVYEYLKGQNLNVPEDVGLSHHYRRCESNKVGMGDCINDLTEVDRTTFKHAHTLLLNIKSSLQQIFAHCKINKFLR